MNLTWNTNNPDFTPCFQKTVLIWLPCAFLWLFTPLEIFYIKNSINRNVPYGFANIGKLALTGALIILTLVDLTVATVNSDDPMIHAVDFYTPAIKLINSLLSDAIIHFQMYVFVLLDIVCCVVRRES